jgi:putative Mn2+ efflux pump MntP
MFSLFIKDYGKFARHLILCIVASVMTFMCLLAIYFWKRMFSLFITEFKKFARQLILRIVGCCMKLMRRTS